MVLSVNTDSIPSGTHSDKRASAAEGLVFPETLLPPSSYPGFPDEPLSMAQD
jgi:hypothetical protein